MGLSCWLVCERWKSWFTDGMGEIKYGVLDACMNAGTRCLVTTLACPTVRTSVLVKTFNQRGICFAAYSLKPVLSLSPI